MEQLTLTQEGYIEIKNRIKSKLNETVHSFIVIGYYLKQIRDSMAYRNDGYCSIEEFAKGEYGLSASTASRFMDINTEFSKDGNSTEIKSEYMNFEYSKLQEMLTVDRSDRELIVEEATVKQIRELKAAEKEEEKARIEEAQKHLPLLDGINAADNDKNIDDSPGVKTKVIENDVFEEVITAFWKENMELYQKVKAGTVTAAILAEEICPSGSRLFKNGPNMMFFYDILAGMKLRSSINGHAQISAYTYSEMLEKTGQLEISPEKETEADIVTVAAEDSMENQERYVPLPGQMSFEEESNKEKEENKEVAPRQQETEEVAPRQQETEEVARLKAALDYFEKEYYRMLAAGAAPEKRMHYRVAKECIRKLLKLE